MKMRPITFKGYCCCWIVSLIVFAELAFSADFLAPLSSLNASPDQIRLVDKDGRFHYRDKLFSVGKEYVNTSIGIKNWEENNWEVFLENKKVGFYCHDQWYLLKKQNFYTTGIQCPLDKSGRFSHAHKNYQRSNFLIGLKAIRELGFIIVTPLGEGKKEEEGVLVRSPKGKIIASYHAKDSDLVSHVKFKIKDIQDRKIHKNGNIFFNNGEQISLGIEYANMRAHTRVLSDKTWAFDVFNAAGEKLKTVYFPKDGKLSLARYFDLSEDQRKFFRKQFQEIIPSSCLLVQDEYMEKLFETASQLSKEHPNDRIVSVGQSALWFIETAKLLDAAPDRYGYAAFFWVNSGELQEKSPSQEQILAYRKYLSSIGLDPSTIIANVKQGRNTRLVDEYEHYSDSLAFFLKLLVDWAKEENLEAKLREALKIQVFRSSDSLFKKKSSILEFPLEYLEVDDALADYFAMSKKELNLGIDYPYERWMNPSINPLKIPVLKKANLVHFRIIDFLVKRKWIKTPFPEASIPEEEFQKGAFDWQYPQEGTSDWQQAWAKYVKYREIQALIKFREKSPVQNPEFMFKKFQSESSRFPELIHLPWSELLKLLDRNSTDLKFQYGHGSIQSGSPMASIDVYSDAVLKEILQEKIAVLLASQANKNPIMPFNTQDVLDLLQHVFAHEKQKNLTINTIENIKTALTHNTILSSVHWADKTKTIADIIRDSILKQDWNGLEKLLGAQPSNQWFNIKVSPILVSS
jgi:hypothetical protein